jgi:large subunit ribosomal protein L21
LRRGRRRFFPLTSPQVTWYFMPLSKRRKVSFARRGPVMYAVIQTGGKQYKVSPGDVLKVEKLAAKAGETVEIKDVYLVSDGGTMSVGKPALSSARVTAEVLDESKGEKVLIFKHRRRKGFRKTIGHRQHFTTLKVKEIKA